MTGRIAHSSSNNAKPVKKEQAEYDLRNTAYEFHDNIGFRHGFCNHDISQHPAYKFKKVA